MLSVTLFEGLIDGVDYNTFLQILSNVMLTAGQQSGAIRLYNYGYDTSLTSGIVEVYYGGRWNTICRYNSVGGSTWGSYEATVACQQLGYTGAISYSHAGDSE